MRRAYKFGVSVGGPVTVDFPAVMERMRRLRAQIAPVDSVALSASMGVDVYQGYGAPASCGGDRGSFGGSSWQWCSSCGKHPVRSQGNG